MFGIIGFPVPEIAMSAQRIGIKFIGMRNEQAVSLIYFMKYICPFSFGQFKGSAFCVNDMFSVNLLLNK